MNALCMVNKENTGSVAGPRAAVIGPTHRQFWPLTEPCNELPATGPRRSCHRGRAGQILRLDFVLHSIHGNKKTGRAEAVAAETARRAWISTRKRRWSLCKHLTNSAPFYWTIVYSCGKGKLGEGKLLLRMDLRLVTGQKCRASSTSESQINMTMIKML